MRVVFWYPGVFSLLRILKHCWCARDEGLALLAFRKRVEVDPYGALWEWGGTENHCFWFGVAGSDGKVVSLILENLYLKGSLAPEVAQLSDLKLIILCNNFLYGQMPIEIHQLKLLVKLDLRCNQLTYPLPHELGK